MLPFTDAGIRPTVYRMKLLHTGDLHLGKILHEVSLLDDQIHILTQIRTELSQNDYAALIISGDIYDRTVPPAAAVEAFSGFLADIRRHCPDLHICIIPGNHDSGQRLAYADRLLSAQRIHIISDPEQSFKPIIIEKNGERLAIFLLPFLTPLSLDAQTALSPSIGKKDREPDLFDTLDESETRSGLLVSQADLAAAAAGRLEKARPHDIPSVLAAHLFTTGGVTSGSERVFVGTAERVASTLFNGFSYVALGHLHRRQKISERIHYAGSPLPYAFDEADDVKVLLSVDIDYSAPSWPVRVQEVPLTPKRRMACLAAAFDDLRNAPEYETFKDFLLEITLTDATLVAHPVQLLRSRFPSLLSLRQKALVPSAAAEKTVAPAIPAPNGPVDPAADYERFQELLYGSADPEKTAMFRTLLAEAADAT